MPTESGTASTIRRHQDRSDTTERPLCTEPLNTPLRASQIQVRKRVLRKRVWTGCLAMVMETSAAMVVTTLPCSRMVSA